MNGDDMPPEQRARAVRTMLWMTPFGAALVAGLAAVQKADLGLILLLAAVMAVGCLGTALLIHLAGSKAGTWGAVIVTIIRLLARR